MSGLPKGTARLLERADEMHAKGFNCSETVLWALSQHWGLGCPVSCATGMGGGVARLGETCGALTGAIMALGAKVGRTDPADDEGKVTCYRLGQEVAAEFKRAMGSTQCKDIIGFVLASEGGPQRYAAGAFKTGSCKNAIHVAIEAAIRVAGS